MALGNLGTLKNLGTSIKNDSEANGLIGNIEKAVLLFPDSAKEVNLDDGVARMRLAQTLNVDRNSAFAQTRKLRADGVEKISVVSVTTSTLMPNADKDISQIQGKTFKVQFNPSTLQVTARGGGRSLVSNYGAKGENQRTTIQYRSLDPYITVNFSIMFDELNNADSFMEERLTAGATTIAKNVATAAIGKEYTVRPQVEGFLAAIRNETHRTMIFQWGSLRYMGLLNSVSGRYTMFNTAGNPIRAEVQLSMLIGGASKDSFDGASYLDYWKKRYATILAKNAEKNSVRDMTSMTTGTVKEQFNNLINL